MKRPIYFKQLEVGPMQNYVYLLGDPTTHEAAVVDAAWDVDTLVRTAEADGYRITKDLITHFHPDHLGGDLMGHQIRGAAELVAKVPAKVVVHKAELPFVHRLTGLSTSDLIPVEGGDDVTIGNLTVKLLHTPGHTPAGASRRSSAPCPTRRSSTPATTTPTVRARRSATRNAAT